MLDSPIDAFKNDVRFRDHIAHVETIPAKKASFKKIPDLNDTIVDYLDSKDIKLYNHQADTYEAIKRDENVILTTTTASGKTLAFNLPIMDSLIEDEKATALYIYPAKALSNDQLNVLKDLESDLGIDIKPRTYDGDTPKSQRYNIRQKSRVILTNPYQLHLILSWHHQWERFYRNLKYIVIDEAHYYRGVFGSNVAFLIRRLKRIANFYGSDPQFILSSATLANPLELANKLTGEEFTLVDNDTSPSGEKDFILFNPFKNYRNSAESSAPSIHVVTADIFRYLMLKNINKHHAMNVSAIKGKAPECLEDIEAPDCVFIGGSSHMLSQIVDAIEKKRKGVRYVVNAVSLETIDEVRAVIRDKDADDIDMIQLSCSNIRSIGEYHMLQALNPVMIFSFVI